MVPVPIRDWSDAITNSMGQALALLLAASVAVTTGCATTPARPKAPVSGSTVEVDILQINDVYEIGPVEGGKRGGLGLR